MNNRDKDFTRAKVERRRAQREESVAHYLSQLDTADPQEPTEALAAKVTRLNEKLTKLKEEMGKCTTNVFRVNQEPPLRFVRGDSSRTEVAPLRPYSVPKPA